MVSRLIVAVLLLAGLTNGQVASSTSQDMDLISSLGILTGTITGLEPDGTRSLPQPEQVFFQRTDCEKAVFGVRSDYRGEYSIVLSPGHYRIFSIHVEHHTEVRDFLAPSQVRFVEVEPNSNKTFNIVGRYR